MIQVTNVTKHYGATLALDRLTLVVPSGALFGLVGPNAAGKSTLIKLLMGFIFPDQGRIDRGKLAPAQIGYVPERPSFPPRCPANDYLKTAGQLGGLRGKTLRQAVESRLNQVGLTEAAGRRIGSFSKGMLQRLALAHALLCDPPFLLLDEPMDGLDPAGQKHMRDVIRTLPAEGKTVLFSTHRLSEVAEICTHVGVLNRGKLARSGALAEVLSLRPRIVLDVDHLSDELRTRLTALHPAIAIQDGSIVLNGDAIDCKREVLALLLSDGADLLQLVQERTTLEQVYLEAMNS